MSHFFTSIISYFRGADEGLSVDLHASRLAASSGRNSDIGGFQFANMAVLGVTLALGGFILAAALDFGGIFVTAPWIWIAFAFALVLGVLMTLPIGGSMPSKISAYNALAGLAVGFEGLVLQSEALTISGMVVGFAGLFLTIKQRRAMSRLPV